MTAIFRKRNIDYSNFPNKTIFLDKVYEVLENARQLFPKFDLQNYDIPIVFFKSGKKAGCLKMRGWASQWDYNLEFNTHAIKIEWENMYNDTIPHEIAHLVNHYVYKKQGHDSGWRKIAISLGGTGKRTHSYDMSAVANNTKKYLYRSTSGREITLGAVRHRKIQERLLIYRSTKDNSQIKKDGFIREL